MGLNLIANAVGLLVPLGTFFGAVFTGEKVLPIF